MKKKTKILLIIIITLTLFSAQVVSPSLARAQTKLNWNNPNQGKSPYKFKASDYLNPQILTKVVGCTKVVNTIVKSVLRFIRNNLGTSIIKKLAPKTIMKACDVTQTAISAGLAGVPNLTLSGVPLAVLCKEVDIHRTEDPKITKEIKKSNEILKKGETKRQCFDGIAITLARNQLVAMTRATMNWVITGFNGDPMYVRNIDSFMNNLTGKVLQKELNMFKSPNGNYNTVDYPYGRSYSRMAINARSSTENTAGSLKQNLTNYLKNETTIKQFGNDFSTGGWSGWLALTQHQQNNPLGFTIKAAQNTANKQTTIKKEAQDELNQNGGFFSQKKCVLYAKGDGSSTEGDASTTPPKKCEKWEVVTPGSIIKDKISTYINSPERQLELVKTINDSLSVLFSALINKFRLNGLTSLGSDNNGAFTKVSGGFGSNSLVDVNGDKTSSPGNFDMSQPFDLTKDLGNTYYHVEMIDLGSWNAKTNLTQDNQTLYIDTAPYNLETGERVSNTYYTVSTEGDTQLFRNGYNVWNVEDRAYFDGKTWQNWKCFKLNNAKTKCIERQSNPIAKRGILQIQADYTVVARQLLRHLPGIMPKIGELDYCIPGPNPDWKANSSEASKSFSSFVDGLKTKYTQQGFLTRKYVTIDPPMGNIYNDYKSIFNGTSLWPKVIKTTPYEEIKYLSSSEASQKTHHTVIGKFFGWVSSLFTGTTVYSRDGKWKGDKEIANANDKVGNLKKEIMKNYILFNKKYAKIMDTDYGKDSLMQKQFLEKESTPVLTPNPSFLKVAPDALKITQNMLDYNDSVTKEAKDYRENIVEANLNIYKLKIIGREVSKIVEAAQKRRADKLAALKLKNTKIKIRAEENIVKGDLLYNSGTSTDGISTVMRYSPRLRSLGVMSTGESNQNIEMGTSGTMTNGTISDWTIPVDCLVEENLDYYTSSDLMIDFGGSKNERCNDGIDNDLNGLVDAQDPACKAFYHNDDGNDMNDIGSCHPDPNDEITPTVNTQKTCEEIKQKNTCLNTIATYSNPSNSTEKISFGCIWLDNINLGGGLHGGNGGGN